jgi:hypothetical protein
MIKVHYMYGWECLNEPPFTINTLILKKKGMGGKRRVLLKQG